MNIVFFNVAWMKNYQGENESFGGGKFPREQGAGHEVLNFQSFDGKVYGYVQPPYQGDRIGQIKLERINSEFAKQESIDDVFVVWVATDPKIGGRKVVGWYKNATVYRYFQKDISERIYKGNVIEYNASAYKSDARCVPEEDRIFEIPSGKDGFGEAQIWYADERPDIKEHIYQYINTYDDIKSVEARKIVSAYQQDQDRKKYIEKRAIEAVTKFYESNGFTVKSRESDNIGWDLDVSIADIKYHVEVKGTSSLVINVQFSPNEYKKMEEMKLKNYKIAVVLNTLEKPKIKIFSYREQNSGSGWFDEEEKSLMKLDLVEIISARAVIA